MLRATALPLICAVAALAAAGCGESPAPAATPTRPSLVPAGAPIYARGRRPADGRAARGRARRRGQDPAHRRSRGEAARADRRGARRGRRWVDVGEGLRAVARRGGGRLGEQPRGRRSRAGAVDRRDQGRRRRGGGARPLPRGRSGRHVHATAPTTASTTRSTPSGVANGVIDDFVVIGTEDAFKRTADSATTATSLADADRYKDAVGDLDDERPRPLLRGSASRLFDAALKQDPAAAAQLEQFKSFAPARQARADHRRVRGRRRRHGARHRADRRAGGPVPRSRGAVVRVGRPSCSPSCPATRGARSRPGARRGGGVALNSFAGAIGGAAVAGAGQAGDRARPPAGHLLAGSATSAASCAARTRPTLDGALVIEATDDATGRGGVRQARRADRQAVRRGAAAGEGRRRRRRRSRSPATGADKPVVLARGEGRVVVAYGDAGGDRRARARRQARRHRGLRRRGGRPRRRRDAVVPALDAGGDHARRRDGRDRRRLRGGAAVPRDARRRSRRAARPTATACESRIAVSLK